MKTEPAPGEGSIVALKALVKRAEARVMQLEACLLRVAHEVTDRLDEASVPLPGEDKR